MRILRRRPPLSPAAAFVAVLTLLATVTVAPFPAASTAQEAGTVTFEGRGWGHGRGMGQYGALGYALNHGWTSDRILGHYYGNTVAGTVPADGGLRVNLIAHAGRPLVVHLTNGPMQLQPGGAAPKRAVKFELAAHGSWQVSDGDGCSGPWTVRPGLVTADQFVVRPAASAPATHDDMLQVCEYAGDGAFQRTRWYRGSIAAVSTTEGLRAINHVTLDTYIRGVVPRESPASWGDLGGGAGMHALRAQAVAARSYASSEHRWAYAETCDTQSCQVYGGYAVQAVGSAFALLEDARTNRAVAETAGQVRVRNGTVARTEFSSSTGGWTAGGTFPAVPDEGDGIDRNPNRTWTAQVTFATLEQKVGPGRGGYRGVEVLQRNGLGADGGRVTSVRIRFENGDVTMTGLQFRAATGLKSDWFTVAGQQATDGVAGYVLDGWGGLHPVGSMPKARGFRYTAGQDVALRVVIRPDGAGYVLDRFGGLHPFGTTETAVPARPYEGQKWPGWNIARDVTLLPSDPSSGFVLDGFGGIHPFGAAPSVRPSAYWRGWDIARRIVVNPSGTGGYVMDAYGGLHAFAMPGTAPPPKPAGLAYWRGWEIARDFVLIADTAGWTLDAFGGMHPFGGATGKGTWYSSREASAVAASADVPGRWAVYLDAFGGVHTTTSAPFVDDTRRWAGWAIARDVAIRPR